MPYVVHYIHVKTLTPNIKSFYGTYDQAVKNLKGDVEEYLRNNKHVTTVNYIMKKDELQKYDCKDGYYIKISNKYPNRITIYERSSKDVGLVFSSIVTTVRKLVVFTLLELSCVPDSINLEIESPTTIKRVALKSQELAYMKELFEVLEKRRQKIHQD